MAQIELQLPIKSGKQNAYDEMVHDIGNIDERTIYICEDSGNLYFGTIQLCTTPSANVVSNVTYNNDSNVITIHYPDKESQMIYLPTEAVLGTF